MKTLLYTTFLSLFALSFIPTTEACSIFTVVRDGQVLMGNNEDYVLPGYIWFSPAKKGQYGRVNVGFKDGFAQGSMNEKGLSFDGAALNEIPWEEDPSKPTPKNIMELIMNECSTVQEAIGYFNRYNCTHLKNAQIMIADATGDSAVITWVPEKGLSVVRIQNDHLVVTNDRLEVSGYRDQRFVRAEQILAQHTTPPLETMVAIMDSIRQHGPLAFTSYSTVYDLKNRTIFLYNLGNFTEVVEFDLVTELQKKPKRYKMVSLFENSPKLRDIKKTEQRREYGTQITLDDSILNRYVGTYSPVGASEVKFTVKRTDTGLRVSNPGKPDAFLYPETDTLFRVHPNPGQVSFILNGKNEVIRLVLHKQRDLIANRVSP